MNTIRIMGAAALAILIWGSGMGRSQQTLSPKARQIIDYLLADWQHHMHSTSIALAMSNLGMEADDDLRLEVGEHFRAHTELANNLQFWGANNYILSSEEKRIAKQIINTFEREERLPERRELAAELSIEPDRLRDRMAFMSRAGLLTDTSEGPGYGLTEKYASWGGPLRYNYHTITIGEDKPFDVW